MHVPDPARVNVASQRFRSFFDELRHSFVERDDLLAQVALALLAKEHVLMTGPPGTAKSQVASSVLARIVDEHTGQPSLYARQFTESTVQTDLVGPIDFKTLMDTGRTQHFTDQGILGAVHAFLDEVFDGRDMLLRAALNVLHERELKEGTTTTRGQIECAIMTSNRYLAEILESSRDTLLAFVDRIAFIAFMPRGFADPKNLGTVLRRHVGGVGHLVLSSPLTVQDLDALQATVDAVHVSEAACDAIAGFLESLQLELASAAKSDPSFVPTRYISTRTAVRCGRVLRAIAVFDRIFSRPDRPLEVLPMDFAQLRLHLLLAGPTPEMVEKLLARETDPRERRQLSIARTEREAFERCVAKVPKFAPSAPATTELASMEKRARAAIVSHDPEKLARSLGEIAQIAQAGGPSAERAATLVREVADSLASRALRAGLLASAAPHHGKVDVEQVVTELESLASKLDEAARPESKDAQLLARWVRGRALRLLDDVSTWAAGEREGDVGAVLAVADDVPTRIARRLARAEALADARRRVERAGVAGVDPAQSAKVARAAAKRLEEDIAVLLDAGFRRSVANVLAMTPKAQLGEVLAALGTDLARLDELGERIAALSGERSALKERLVGPRVADLIAAIFRAIDASDRGALLLQVERLHSTLARSGLGAAIEPFQWIVWSTVAMVRADRGGPPDVKSAHPDHKSYLALRNAEQRTPIALTLREIALRVAPLPVGPGTSPDEAERALVALLSQVPEELASDAAAADLDRVERAIDHLERWLFGLTGGHDAEEVPLDDARERLSSLVASKFLHVVYDDAALLRFTLETRMVSEGFPACEARARALAERIDALGAGLRRYALALARASGDRAWSEVLSSGAP